MTKQQWNNTPAMQIDQDKTYEIMIQGSQRGVEPELCPQLHLNGHHTVFGKVVNGQPGSSVIGWQNDRPARSELSRLDR